MRDAQPSLVHYLNVVRRQWWLILTVLVVTMGVTAALTHYESPVYESSMKIVVGQGGVVVGRNGSLFEPALTSDVNRFTATMRNLLESHVVADTVISDLNLSTSPENLLSRMHVSSQPDSSVLDVTYRSHNKGAAVAILADVGRVFTKLVQKRLGAVGNPAGGGTSQPNLSPVTTTVFDPAHAEPSAISPRPVRNLVLAGVLGLLLGLALAFTRDSLDNRIRSRRDAEDWFDAPVVGSLPRGVRGKPVKELRDTRRFEHASEALNLLRANLQFAQLGLDHGTIVVTSALPEDGKSTIVANLSVTLALAGNDVVCVDADLHRPMLHRYFGVRPDRPGLVDVIKGKKLATTLYPLDLPVTSRNGRALSRARNGGPAGTPGRLRLLPPGSHIEHPSALFGDGRAGITALFEELSQQARYVIVDTPPLLAIADAFPFALAADGVLVAARYGRTTRHNAQAVNTTLEGLGAERVAIVLLDVPVSDTSGYYGYGYANRRQEGTPAA